MIWTTVINKDIANIVDIANYIKSQSINISELLFFLKDKIINLKIKDNIKSKLIIIITNTEARLLERGDEFINIMYLLGEININLKN